MKRMMIFVAALVSFCLSHAQVLEEGEPVLVYYSPRTHVVLDFSYTVETCETGVYAQYAEELLGVTDAVEEETKTTYTLTGVTVHTRTDADTTRPHKVVTEAGMPIQLLSINEKGLLTGYNLPYETPAAKQSKHSADAAPRKTASYKVPPFTDEVIEAKSAAAQAQAVAKHILRIRETRMYLLSGEVEHAPADGEAMRLVLDEMNKQEKQLVELFTGTRKRVTKHKKVEYTPTNETYPLLEKKLYFSPENGFTSAENVDAAEVAVTIQIARPQLIPAAPINPKAKKKVEPLGSQIVYNLPGSGQLRVLYQGELMAEKTLPMAQFGVDVPLAKDLFTGPALPTIKISERTGNVVSITK